MKVVEHWRAPRSSVSTTAYLSRLEKAGIPPEQARAHAEALEELVMGDYVTKDHLDARLTQVESALRTTISQLESTLIRWMVGTVGAGMALTVTFLKLLK